MIASAASSPLPGALPWDLCSKKAEISLMLPWSTATSGHGPLILLLLELLIEEMPLWWLLAWQSLFVNFIEIWLICSVVFISAVQRSFLKTRVLSQDLICSGLNDPAEKVLGGFFGPYSAPRSLQDWSQYLIFILSWFSLFSAPAASICPHFFICIFWNTREWNLHTG